MGEKRERDVEKVYSTSEFVAKLRRLADALEAGERFEIRVAEERIYVPAQRSDDRAGRECGSVDDRLFRGEGEDDRTEDEPETSPYQPATSY
jgi:hypothetical protein